MNTEQFITEILSRPAIWMSKHPQHKYRHIIKKMWEEIKQQFPGSDDESLKKKWKNLKDNYRKELKKLPTCRSGDEGSDYQSPWKYFELLSFLKDEFMPIEGESNLIEEDTPTLDLTEESSPLPPFQSPPPPPSVSPIPLSPTSPPQQPPTPHSSRQQLNQPQAPETQNSSRKRLKTTEIRAEYLEIEKKKLKLLEADLAGNKEKEVVRSDDYHFLMSLLPEMEKLSVLQKLRLRNKFTQALMDEISLNQYPGYQSYYPIQPPTCDYGIINNNNS